MFIFKYMDSVAIHLTFFLWKCIIHFIYVVQEFKVVEYIHIQ